MRSLATSPLLRPLVGLAVMLPATAFAHPGHDGPHDFEWELGHLAAHPLATLAGLALLAAGLLLVRFLVRRRAPAARARARR